MFIDDIVMKWAESAIIQKACETPSGFKDESGKSLSVGDMWFDGLYHWGEVVECVTGVFTTHDPNLSQSIRDWDNYLHDLQIKMGLVHGRMSPVDIAFELYRDPVARFVDLS